MYSIVKRFFDVIGALVLIVLTAPLLLAIAAAIRLTMGRPVIFRQMRPGLNERLFTCLKFRTMNNTCDQEGRLQGDGERVTSLGSVLRRTSLDELPQFWNILRGDLSFVGPRPMFVRYLPYYTQEERRRHSVRPGLTGLAQIEGRNCLSFDKRLELDVWYVEHLSPRLDLRILLTTVWIVLTGRGFEGGENVPLDEQRSVNCAHSPKAAPAK